MKWNNAFQQIFNCYWRESVKSLQFYCCHLPLSYITDQHKLQLIVVRCCIVTLHLDHWCLD